METEDLELRLQRLKEELQSGLDAMQHAQRMRSMSAGQQMEGTLEQIRRDLATVTSRMVSQAEFQHLRQAVEALGATAGKGGLGHEVVELLPRLMQELTRLREECGISTPAPAQAFPRIQELEAQVQELARQLQGLAPREPSLRAQDLEARLGREAEERARQIEDLRSGLERLEKKVSSPRAPESQPSTPAAQAVPGPGSQDLQDLRREMEAGLEAVRTAIPVALSELRRQLPQVRGGAGALEALSKRLEALEGARHDRQEDSGPALEAFARRLEALEKSRHEDPAPALEALSRRLEALEGGRHEDPAPALEALSRRLEALEGGRHEDPAPALELLSKRLGALESEEAGEREHVREVFRDLLEEHDLLLRRLESRLTLLVQDFNRLSEGQDPT